MRQKNKFLEWLKVKTKNETSQGKEFAKDTNNSNNNTINDDDKLIKSSAYSTSKSKKQDRKKDDFDLLHEEEKEELELEEEPIITELSNEDISKNIIIDDLTIKNDTLQEIEKMLRSDRYEIERISYELNNLKKEEEQDDNTINEIEDLIERLNNLIRRFEKIKKDFYTKYYDEIDIDTNSDNYIKHLIDEYKIAIKNDNIKDATILEIKQIEEYISLINEMIEIENESSKLNDSLEEKKEEITEADRGIDEFDEDYKQVDKINNYINRFAKDQSHILSELEKKIENQEIVSKSVEYQSEIVTDYTKLLSSILLLASTSTIPPTKNGNILKAALVAGAITGIMTSRKLVMKEKKTVTKTTYIDYEKEILNSINNVNELSIIVDKTLLDIKQLKKDFEHDFSNFADSIPNFYDMITKLDSIEKDLEVKNQIIKDFDKRLDKTKKKNSNKIKKIEVDYPK